MRPLLPELAKEIATALLSLSLLRVREDEEQEIVAKQASSMMDGFCIMETDSVD